MMKTQTKKGISRGFGFPVVLMNVPLIGVFGVWTSDIDYNLLQKAVLFALAHHPSGLTGNHVRFIRFWF
jgi:hypothetical protein